MLGQENYMIIVHTKTQSRRFPHSSSFKNVFEKFGFLLWIIGTLDLIEEMKLDFQTSPA